MAENRQISEGGFAYVWLAEALTPLDPVAGGETLRRVFYAGALLEIHNILSQFKFYTAKLRMAHESSYSSFDGHCYMDN